ncbi:unnamed protein product [Rotaria magnacalcarata]|uniref:Uncharacterized protein n=2 Tax=Rotaria magnacalcarata TaxID=392030 RepID=A0A815AEA9_9BILA|nr:unnamed protein product [Rotaria magnacalcarata]
MIKNKRKLANLKRFMLTLESELLIYNNFLITRLHRMPNLQELSLYFANHIAPIINGNNLEANIFNHMTKLKKYEFNIRSTIPFNNQFHLPSNEDIQNTFKKL